MFLVFGEIIGVDIFIIGLSGNLIVKNIIEIFSKGSLLVLFFEYVKIGIFLLIVCFIFFYFFGLKFIVDCDGNI